MAGNKNSGRKSFVDEFKSKHISKLSQDILIKILEADESIIPLTEKLKASLPIVLKTMPDKIELDNINELSYEEKIQIIESIRLLTKQPIMDLIPDDPSSTRA